MRMLGIACLGLGMLLLQGCGGSSKGAAASVASSVQTVSSSVKTISSSAKSVSSAASSSSRSSASAGLSVAETHLGAGNLPPDSGIAAAASLAAEDFSPEFTQARALAADALPPF